MKRNIPIVVPSAAVALASGFAEAAATQGNTANERLELKEVVVSTGNRDISFQ